MSQKNPSVYAQAIQYTLAQTVTPVPCYANFNRNYATQPTFITWQLRNVHQPVYTGQTQGIKGIDRPVFQVSVFAQGMNDAFNLSNTILQSLHGYSGGYGDVTTANTFYAAKTDITWLYNTYDDELKLHQIVLDCQLDIPT